MKTFAFLLIALPLLAQSSDLPPSTAVATAQYEAAIAKAKQAYILKLQEAASSEVKKGNLDGVAAIKAKIEELAERKGTGRLQIVKATYGADKQTVDCTQNVQDLVDDDSLSIKADCGWFAPILKIADPVPGQIKTLTIEYVFDGRKRKAEVRDGQMVEIGKSHPKEKK